MKAIIFAAAGFFAAAVFSTPGAARPAFQDFAENAFGNRSPGIRKTFSRRHAIQRRRAGLGRHAAMKGRASLRRYSGLKRTTLRHRSEARRRSDASPARRVEKLNASYRGVGAKPARWCGWWMRTQKGGGPEMNLARNWKDWGRPTPPRVGAVVVWNHHVGLITGQTANGQWIIKSGNDGGRVRERPRSVKGAVFRI